MKKGVSVKHTNPGWAKELLAKVKDLASKEVAAGFPMGSSKAAQTYDNGASVLDVAVWNQFGATIKHPGGTAYKREMTSNGDFAMGNAQYKTRFVKNKNAGELPRTSAHTITIPARPFMDEAVKIIDEDIKGVGADLAKQVINDNMSASQALKQIGQVAESAVKQAITDGVYEPNAPSTKRKKKSSKPLGDTGKMRQAVVSIVREKNN